MARKYFFLVVRTESPRWPFSWGPFGGSRTRKLKVRLVDIDIFQRTGSGITNKPLLIRCAPSDDGRDCTTRVFDDGAQVWRRRTGVQP